MSKRRNKNTHSYSKTPFEKSVENCKLNPNEEQTFRNTTSALNTFSKDGWADHYKILLRTYARLARSGIMGREGNLNPFFPAPIYHIPAEHKVFFEENHELLVELVDEGLVDISVFVFEYLKRIHERSRLEVFEGLGT